jgi:hypothetical protein
MSVLYLDCLSLSEIVQIKSISPFGQSSKIVASSGGYLATMMDKISKCYLYSAKEARFSSSVMFQIVFLTRYDALH